MPNIYVNSIAVNKIARNKRPYDSGNILANGTINSSNSQLSQSDILTNLSSREVTVEFSEPFLNIPVGRKNLHVYRLFPAEPGKIVDQDVLCYGLTVTKTGFSLTIDESEDLESIIIEYNFFEQTKITT